MARLDKRDSWRVVGYWALGYGIADLAELFDISEQAIKNWIKKRIDAAPAEILDDATREDDLEPDYTLAYREPWFVARSQAMRLREEWYASDHR